MKHNVKLLRQGGRMKKNIKKDLYFFIFIIISIPIIKLEKQGLKDLHYITYPIIVFC